MNNNNPWGNNNNMNNNNPWDNNSNNWNRNNRNSNNNTTNDWQMKPTSSKRSRHDPQKLGEDDMVIPKQGSMLGKRKRRNNDQQLYYGQEARAVTQPSPYNMSGKSEMDIDGEDEDTLMFNNGNNNINTIKFEKGLMIDIKVKDDHGDEYWTTGTICMIREDRGILIHIPRFEPSNKWVQRNDPNIAPPGSHNSTEGYNWNNN